MYMYEATNEITVHCHIRKYYINVKAHIYELVNQPRHLRDKSWDIVEKIKWCI